MIATARGTGTQSRGGRIRQSRSPEKRVVSRPSGFKASFEVEVPAPARNPVGFMLDKRGVSVWISYVILTAMVIALGFLVLQFTKETTQETVDDIVERGEALQACSVSGVDVRNICQTTQVISMSITNTNDIRIVGIWARMFDIYDNPQSSSRNLTINPQKTKELSILKQGIISRVEVIPVIRDNSRLIKCQSRTVAFEPVEVCG